VLPTWSSLTAKKTKASPPETRLFINNTYEGRPRQSVKRLATGWTVRGSKPGAGEGFSAPVQIRHAVPPSLRYVYNGYHVPFPGAKRPGLGVDHPPPSSAKVKERVELYFYSPSEPSWSALGKNLPFTPFSAYKLQNSSSAFPTVFSISNVSFIILLPCLLEWLDYRHSVVV
jgi:hypothetical protein